MIIKEYKNHNYYYEIDILRGVACLLVAFSHLPISNIFTFSGINGVYLFFIISGFIITKTFDDQFKKNDNFNITNWLTAIKDNKNKIYLFWYNRYVRLFPAFALLLACGSIVIMKCAIKQHETILGIAEILRYIIGFIFFNNPVTALASNHIAELLNNIFLVTWSLTAEMFFYLIFPFLMVFSKLKKVLPIFFIIIFLTNFCLSKYLGIYIVYYSIFGHFDAFILGMLIAFYHEKVQLNKSILGSLTITSVLIIFLTCPFVNFSFMNYLHILLAASFLVYTATLNKNILNPFLLGKVLNHIGRHSYFIYLMHVIIARLLKQPIYKLLNILAVKTSYLKILILKKSEEMGHIENFLILLIIIILANLFHRFVEIPFSKKYRKNLKFNSHD